MSVEECPLLRASMIVSEYRIKSINFMHFSNGMAALIEASNRGPYILMNALIVGYRLHSPKLSHV